MKVEVELPDPPEGWGYTGEYRQTKGVEHVYANGRVTEYGDSAGHYFILRKIEPPYLAPEGYEFTGEFRDPRPDECFLNKYTGKLHDPTKCFRWGTPDPVWILRKKKPTYTEAVKATGWKWPADLHPRWRFFGYGDDEAVIDTELMLRNYDESTWLYTTPGWPDVGFNEPPRLADDYEWHETLLCRDDFV